MEQRRDQRIAEDHEDLAGRWQLLQELKRCGIWPGAGGPALEPGYGR